MTEVDKSAANEAESTSLPTTIDKEKVKSVLKYCVKKENTETKKCQDFYKMAKEFCKSTESRRAACTRFIAWYRNYKDNKEREFWEKKMAEASRKKELRKTREAFYNYVNEMKPNKLRAKEDQVYGE